MGEKVEKGVKIVKRVVVQRVYENGSRIELSGHDIVDEGRSLMLSPEAFERLLAGGLPVIEMLRVILGVIGKDGFIYRESVLDHWLGSRKVKGSMHRFYAGWGGLRASGCIRREGLHWEFVNGVRVVWEKL